MCSVVVPLMVWFDILLHTVLTSVKVINTNAAATSVFGASMAATVH